MATPLTPSSLKAAYVAEGIVVKEYPGWRDRCRCHVGSHERNEGWAGRTWGKMYGQLNHITGGDLGGRTVSQYIRDIINGDPNLPCKVQVVIAPNGELWLNSAGRCNHAGGVGTAVDDHMIAADFSLTDNYDDRWRGSGLDGNGFMIGYEVITSKDMTTAAYNTLVKANAAVARKFQWDGRESAGHGECSSARVYVDPGLHMGNFRSKVVARIKAGPTGTAPAPAPAPTPDPVVVVEPAPAPTPDPVVPNPTPVVTGPDSIFVKDFYLNRADYDDKHGAASRDARDANVARVALASNPLWIHLVECAASQVDDMDALFPGYHRLGVGGKGRESWYKEGQGIKIIAAALDNVDVMLMSDTKEFLKIVWEKQGVRSATAVFHNENEGTSVQRAQMWDVVESIRDYGKAHGAVLRNTAAFGDTNWKPASGALWDSGYWKNGILHADTEINSGLHTTNGWSGPTTAGRPIDVVAVRRNAHVVRAENVLLGGDNVSDHNALRTTRELFAA